VLPTSGLPLQWTRSPAQLRPMGTGDLRDGRAEATRNPPTGRWDDRRRKTLP
jgi:hypothetical protein